ncbi:MAG: MoxR family ATPase [Ignavibacteriota bacterium]|nr:MAG: MoxR family ATPase [Chlorobiota bacterium]MBE7477906.1 MoxR family ATPase [Ignavibacteriales bacterium]MBL1123564.1 MoxR family ATPase [Ignavibacteriota bacterium]MCC7095541.1 MoxR family ATPase [Ignavibacteriaceae bacterium]MCE7857002.1 MoxR family ATPase [Ignavibacteria bacterium CHB3]MEB2296703.1 MoxR family ATPase [Ignavibacteria bacterium]
MEETNFTPRTDLTELKESVDRVRTEVKKIIVGQENIIDLMIAAVLADGHILIEGVPGIAKTLLAKIIAKTISADFSRIQFTPDLMPSDILGTSVFNIKTSEFEFNRGPIFSNIILIDEINRAPAKTQSALFESMEERQVTIDGKTYKMESPFTVFATQNPIEHEGTYKLPEAQLDRFLFKVQMDYPLEHQEVKILLDLHSRKNINDLNLIQPVFTRDKLQQLREKVRTAHLDEKVAGYITRVVNKTRNNSDLYLGGSPRASISIMIGAKAVAAMNGRDFVTPDDVKMVVYPALRHRIILTPEKEMEGKTPDDIIKTILERAEVPR